MSYNKRSSCVCHRRGGMVMVLVLVAVSIATVVGLSVLAASTSTSSVMVMVDEHAQARQIAESGLQLGKSYIEHAPSWIEDQENGVWVSHFPLFGGHVTLQAQFDEDPPVTAIAVTNHSFESATGNLSNGILGLVLPAMSGTIGGWSVQRAGLLGALLSTTVPDVRVLNDGAATDGGRLARVVFVAGTLAEASFERTLAYKLEPLTTYTLKVDVGMAGVLNLLPSHELVVKAGGYEVSAKDGHLLDLLDLNGNFHTKALRFTTPAAVPDEHVKLRLYTNTVLAVSQGIGFDHVRFEKNRPVTVVLTATATYGQASHVVSAMVLPMGSTEPAKIVLWRDP